LLLYYQKDFNLGLVAVPIINQDIFSGVFAGVVLSTVGRTGVEMTTCSL